MALQFSMRLPSWSACAPDESRCAELANEHEVAEGSLSSLAAFRFTRETRPEAFHPLKEIRGDERVPTERVPSGRTASDKNFMRI